MSHAAVLRTCHVPCKSGCPSGVRGGAYVVVAEACAATGVGASVKIARAARAITDPTNLRLTGNLLSLLDLELHQLQPRRAGVADGSRDACVLPEEFAHLRAHGTTWLATHAL